MAWVGELNHILMTETVMVLKKCVDMHRSNCNESKINPLELVFERLF